MVISNSMTVKAAADWSTSSATRAQASGFQEQLQAAQSPSSSTPASRSSPTEASRSNESSFYINEQKAAYEDVPLEIRQMWEANDARRSQEAAYREKVQNDPNYGSQARIRAYDPTTDEAAMISFMELERITGMTPEQYYNYKGSDQERYDALVQQAAHPQHDGMQRLFGTNLEQESKVQMVRDLQAENEPLPKSYAEFEQAWQSDVARQIALQQEQLKLLEL